MKRRVSYVDVDDVAVAYEVIGDGPVDVLLFDQWWTHIDMEWEDPYRARFLRRLADSARIIHFDKSGMGLSDRVPPNPIIAMQRWADEAAAVLDDLRVERVALSVGAWSGPLGLTFASRYPERVERLGLATAFSTMRSRQDVVAVDPEVVDIGRAILLERWGSGVIADILGQARAELPEHQLDLEARYERATIARRDLPAIVDALDRADATSTLASIGVPTHVAHRENPLLPVAHAEMLAAAIAGATLEIIPSEWYFPLVEDDLLPDVLACHAFLTGSEQDTERGRALLTVVFQDIVGSTGLVERLGDREWADALSALTAVVEAQLTHFDGRLVDQAGDGYFTVFTSPRRALNFALAVADRAGALGLPVRSGIHTGDCHVDGTRVRGMTVHAAARIMAFARVGAVVTSAAVRELLRTEPFDFEAIGSHDLRGLPGPWDLFELCR